MRHGVCFVSAFMLSRHRRRLNSDRKPVQRHTIALALASLAVAIAAVTLLTQPVWKPYAKRWRWFVISTNVYQDLLRRTGLKHDQIGQGSFERPLSEVPAALARIDDIFTGTLHHLDLLPDDLEGRAVLEVGPGDNIGVALRFVAAGAARVVSIDKFVPMQTSRFHQALYQALRRELTPTEQARLDAAIDLGSADGAAAVRLKDGSLTYVYGRGIEDARDRLGRQSFDLIVSNAVLEEVYDIDTTLDALDDVLRPGGEQLHKIDLSDYGMFTKHGFHPLEFLTITDPVYRLMVESTGQPNRRRIDYYRAKSDGYGYDTRIYTTAIVGRDGEFVPPRATVQAGRDYGERTLATVRAIRPRLLARYQRLSDEDLMVQGIVLVTRKPAARARR